MSNVSWLTQIKKGLLELCILNILNKQSMYGYEIVKYLRSIPRLAVTEGTIYPLLGRLKREGLVVTTYEESPSGPVRKNYNLSAEGRRRLKAINRVWDDIAGAINTLVSRDQQGDKGDKTSAGERGKRK